MSTNKFDTVEEYWSKNDIHQAAHNANSLSASLFEECLQNYLGVQRVHTIPSARWGLTWLLQSIHSLVGSGVVLVPAFNCIVVADAIKKARFQLEGYDFSSANGSVDWEGLVERIKSASQLRPVAIIVTHYFGVPVDWFSIRELCKERNVFIIEDCAHTLGGGVSGYTTGTLSDAAVYSFNYDKPISLGWGGAIALNNKLLKGLWRDDLFKILDVQNELSYLNDFISTMKERRDNIGNNVNILTRIMTKVGLSKYNIFNMPAVGIGPLRSQLGINMLEKFDDIRGIRNKNAEILRKIIPSYQLWNIDKNVELSRLKMKVGVENQKKLNEVTIRLQKLGYRVGNFNWPSLIDTSHNCKSAKITSQLWIDVPIHQNLSRDDLVIIADSLESISSQA